ncbi:carboxypeptidase-like regulatory domain-containing protein [Mucilaginibacter gracilis]|nr:carboxypeptidase-like regulatory domain-containing protein [Mucilaginibacter gracilis]
MIKLVRHLFFTLILTILACRAFAQPGSISISGKVTALNDGHPIVQASISISRKGVGTATNAAGMFVLIIPANNLGDTLKISCVGFKTKQLPIASLTNKAELNLALENNNTELKEVTIAYYDAVKIIEKAISRIPDNYINHPHILRGFYRMYTYSGQAPLQLSEAVFDVYNFGYADKHADLFKLIKARNEKNERDFNAVELGQKPNSVFEDDIINHINACGFLNNEGLTKHRFEVKGIVDFKGYEAYQIDFKEKTPELEGTFRGSIYIETKTYAFIHFDFGLSPFALGDLSSWNFISRALMKMGDVKIDLEKNHAQVSYQMVGNKWALLSMQSNDVLAIENTSAHTHLPANVKFNYQVTAVDTVEKAPFSSKLGRNENINNYDGSVGEKFWKDYNILLSDYNTEDIFKQIQEINKAIKKAK